MKTAIILGAGFSFAGGLPLTRDLFETKGTLPRFVSQSGERQHQQVMEA